MTINNKRNYSDVKKYSNHIITKKIRNKVYETERYKKAATLRNYAKLCKKEGILSDRVNLNDKKKSTSDDNDDIRVKKSIKDNKSNVKPFENEMNLSKLNEINLLKKLEEKKAKESEINQAKVIRDNKRKLHLKRTKKGQPLLNNQIKNILEKLNSN